MLETIVYNENLKVVVFDEPVEEYYEIMLEAAADDHRLSKNYRKDILASMEFMCVWILNESPLLIYGLQRDKDLPQNVARAFSRFFIVKDARSHLAKMNRPYVEKALNFFNEHPQFHENLGIDTLFFTRNVHGKNQERFFTRTLQKYGFNLLEEIKLYKGEHQRFFVSGDRTFVTMLPSVEPTN